ncbi:MAG: c-type cytochrome [Proteobacteria bacterium]|nr:c-type cytochrome [Pseudomonadota bacterium]
MKSRLFVALAAGIALAAGAGSALAGNAAEPLRPLPEHLGLNPGKVELGSLLFVDKRLSADDTIACSSCHDFSHGGADPRPRSVGIHGATSAVNAPTVFNSGLNFRELWSGSAPSLEAFVTGVVQNPKVFGSKWSDVVVKISRDPDLSVRFARLYGNGVTRDNIVDAIATYTRSLVTPSRFDRYLRGDTRAITAGEAQGYERFKSYGCIACHQGVNVGGNMYQKFGVMGDYFRDHGHDTPADQGRYAVTGRDSDRHVFKVPSLRNVALTAPYFHDGSAPTLEAAVDVMFRYQLGRAAPPADKALIVEFLKTLTGERQPVLAKAVPEAPAQNAVASASHSGARSMQ